ncbi:MAG: hypothetical protein QG604_607 [Candidatus Dependentiae bacterium]|nr:hypothetical protein [Candidatus Dependentiae bacterium]
MKKMLYFIGILSLVAMSPIHAEGADEGRTPPVASADDQKIIDDQLTPLAKQMGDILKATPLTSKGGKWALMKMLQDQGVLKKFGGKHGGAHGGHGPHGDSSDTGHTS